MEEKKGQKDCHIDLVLLPAMMGGDVRRRVSQRKQALHVRRENMLLLLRWDSNTRKRQHKFCVYTYMRSLVRRAEEVKWSYSSQYRGACWYLNKHGSLITHLLCVPAPNTHAHTNTHHVTSSSNCSLLFCISPSSCFLPLSICFGFGS